MERWRLEPLVGNLVAELLGTDPVGSCEAEGFLRAAGFDLLVAVRPDLNYASSWCHRPRDPECRFRVYHLCFRAWGTPGAKELYRPLPVDRAIPLPTETDLFLLGEYLLYELVHGRRVPIWFHPSLTGAGGIADLVRQSIRERLTALAEEGDGALQAQWDAQPARLRAQSERDRAWLPPLVSHATSLEAVLGILSSGALLAPTELSGLPGVELARQPRNIPCDPPDYFDYVMLMPGDDRAIGDWVVYQRLVNRSPSDPTNPLTWDEFAAHFIPAAKLFFGVAALLRHPGICSDGFHALKLRRSLPLAPYLVALVLPSELRGAEQIATLARAEGLGDRVVMLGHGGLTPEKWAGRAYRAALAARP